ncbi:glycosyltransferase family 4 protein [Haloferula sp. BvORR071]|uniref:glycosyltransferase family 4 protein n=1 Tax=Haloferula sp. BvORR071 TaxID=1396141 RepID=UPI0006988D0E|nr:glycosyltransferase family 4 protein [Haloferula sp. BvORR071]
MSSGGEKKAIALCLEYPIADRGGVSVLVQELVAGLSEDFAIRLVSPEPSEGVLASKIGAQLAGHLSFQLMSVPPSPSYFKQARAFAEQLGDVRLVHFHCGGTFGWGNRCPAPSIPEYCSKAGLKTVWTNHLTDPPRRAFASVGRAPWISDLAAPIGKLGKIRQTRATDAEIAVSEHDRDYLDSQYPADQQRRRIYHSRLEESPAPGTEREPLILAVGHVAYRKGQDVLVRAFLNIAGTAPGWTLEIAGHDGGDGCWQEIESLCANHPQGSRVKLLGAHPRPAELMGRASIFVQPSLEEALGLALQEAIFLGCPAIGSRVGGIPEVIDEGETGLLIEPKNVAALSAALSRLLVDAALRGQMGARGRDAILGKGMTRQRMIEAHRSLYLELLA